MKNEIKKVKEHLEFSFRKSLKKIFNHMNNRIMRMSVIDDAEMRRVCQMAGIEYKSQSEQEAVEELKQYTYQRLNELRDNLQHRQEQLSQEMSELTQKMNAISTSLMIVLRAEEEKLEIDKEQQAEEKRRLQWEKHIQDDWFEKLQEKAKTGWGQKKDS